MGRCAGTDRRIVFWYYYPETDQPTAGHDGQYAFRRRPRRCGRERGVARQGSTETGRRAAHEHRVGLSRTDGGFVI